MTGNIVSANAWNTLAKFMGGWNPKIDALVERHMRKNKIIGLTLHLPEGRKRYGTHAGPDLITVWAKFKDYTTFTEEDRNPCA